MDRQLNTRDLRLHNKTHTTMNITVPKPQLKPMLFYKGNINIQ